MSDRLNQPLIHDAYTYLRQEGPVATLKAGLRRMNINCEGYYYYANYWYKRFQGRNCVDEMDLFRTLTVDPDLIIYLPTQRFDKWKNIGEIRNGDWDRPSRKFEDRALFQALKSRYEGGKNWSDVKYVQQALDRVRSGNSTWNGCRSTQDVRQRCEKLDQLYETIRDHGFQSQAELHDTEPKDLLLSGTFDRSRTDIAVHIARNGEFRFVDGNHRLAMAKILDLDEVPVRVVIRHQQWQQIRKSIKQADDSTQFDEQINRYRDHPDVKHLL